MWCLGWIKLPARRLYHPPLLCLPVARQIPIHQIPILKKIGTMNLSHSFASAPLHQGHLPSLTSTKDSPPQKNHPHPVAARLNRIKKKTADQTINLPVVVVVVKNDSIGFFGDLSLLLS